MSLLAREALVNKDILCTLLNKHEPVHRSVSTLPSPSIPIVPTVFLLSLNRCLVISSSAPLGGLVWIRRSCLSFLAIFRDTALGAVLQKRQKEAPDSERRLKKDRFIARAVLQKKRKANISWRENRCLWQNKRTIWTAQTVPTPSS